MKLSMFLLLATCVVAGAEAEERIKKHFAVKPGGSLVLDVDFGSIEVKTNATDEVTVEVYRKVVRRYADEEKQFLLERPVNFTHEGNSVTVKSRSKNTRISNSSGGWLWRPATRTEAKYTISVPAKFNAQVHTSGGSIEVSDLTGDTKASTSGGRLEFERLKGTLVGSTSGGSIRIENCDGPQKVNTSGGPIEVKGGTGSFDGATSGGSVTVRHFDGGVRVGTSGGGITIEDVSGQVNGNTSGGSISVKFSQPVDDEVKLSTSGGAVTVVVPSESKFELDASTSGGGVHVDLPVEIEGKRQPNKLKGAVNGGGKPVVLRSSGGSVSVRKL